MTRGAKNGPGSQIPAAKKALWHQLSFVEHRSQREACRLAGISRHNAREMHRLERARMALGGK